VLDHYVADIAALRERSTRAVEVCVERAGRDLAHTAAQLHALSPAGTLDRGYAIVTRGPHVISDADEAAVGEALEVRLARGRLDVSVTRTAPAPSR
jgi:exodeoxyribonuclease VII large subunit